MISMKKIIAAALTGISIMAIGNTSMAAKPEGNVTPMKWWQNNAVYQIYPKSYADTNADGIGDLPGITKNLDYIKSLGAGAIWLTPVYPSPMVDNGYDIADYSAIDPTYGTMADFDRLIAEGKKRNIRIVMDLVFNHSSDQHPWFQESKQSRTNLRADWYIWRDPKPDGSPPTNWRSIFGGSAWTWCEERQQYYLHTFASQQPDLNWENPEVRQALFDAANFWIDKGVGGFRIDAITYIKKPAFTDGEPDAADGMSGIHNMTANTPGILDFLHEFKNNVFTGHDIFTVGEANGVTPEDLPLWVGTDGVFDMVFEFSHMNLTHKDGEIWYKPTSWKLTELKQALTNSQNATKDNGWCPVFFENHDQPRCVNNFFPPYSDTKKAAKTMAAVLLTMRGTPFIYEGQELGMTNVSWPSIDNYNDISSHGQYEMALSEGFTPEEAMGFVHRFSRDSARTPMQWNDKPNAGFTKGTPWLPVNSNYTDINVTKESGDPDSVLSWYRKLAKLRMDHRELREGTYEELMHENEQLFIFARTSGNKRLVTVANFSNENVTLPADFLTGKKQILGTMDLGEATIIRPLETRIYEAIP